MPAAASAWTDCGYRAARYPTSKNVAFACIFASTARMRSVESGHGPSSNVSATAFGVEDGPDGVKTQDATTPDNDPFVTSMVPAVVVSVHCGSSGVPGGTAIWVRNTGSRSSRPL